MHAALAAHIFDGSYVQVTAFEASWKADGQRDAQTSGRGADIEFLDQKLNGGWPEATTTPAAFWIDAMGDIDVKDRALRVTDVRSNGLCDLKGTVYERDQGKTGAGFELSGG